MLRCLAVDDEPLALDLLEDNIRQVPYLQLAGKCSNGLEAIQFLQQETVDLIFLDIQMPGLTGLQFIQSLTVKPMIILVTAYEKFALDGFNLNVVDYLVKPVSLDRFIWSCNKAFELFQLRNRSGEVVTRPDYFFINVDYSMVKLVFSEIRWIEGLKDYIKIHLKAGKPLVARLSMKAVEEQLPAGQFLRIHKSYIVSKNFITAVRKNSIFMDAVELPVGDNYKEVVEAFVGSR